MINFDPYEPHINVTVAQMREVLARAANLGADMSAREEAEIVAHLEQLKAKLVN